MRVNLEKISNRRRTLMRTSPVSVRRVGFVAALLLGGWLVADVAAVDKKSEHPHARQIAALQASRDLLTRANHDYGGHRILAIREITFAILVLEQKTPNPKLPPGTGVADGGGGERQAASDAQMREALKQLKGTKAKLTPPKGKSPGKVVGRALAAINKAIQELESSLKIN